MEKTDTIWGARNIAEALGVTEKRAFYLLELGALKPAGAKKIGSRWVCSRAKLEAYIQREAA